MNVVLISTYELGHQPFGISSPTAWLKSIGASVVCLDLSIQTLDESSILQADLIAFYVPMHTATKIAISSLKKVKEINPYAHVCFYGLYAPMNEKYLRKLGADTILGGEFEEGLVHLVSRLSDNYKYKTFELQEEPIISITKQKFLVPDRSDLPGLAKYAYLTVGKEKKVVGYTEASRGCKHLCRHCPIVPVYNGRFVIVQRDIVLEDIKNQVKSGATHLTFGDPDFFNGPRHSLEIVRALHTEFPSLTYNVTIKIEHLLKHSQYLQTLKETGCLFVTSAVESIDDTILEFFDKRHTKEEFIKVVHLFREIGLNLQPTFVTFTPWTTLEGYLDLLNLIYQLELYDNIPPIQYAIRLLIPSGSKLLEIEEVRTLVEEYDEQALYYPWKHKDERVDQLCADVLNLITEQQSNNASRRAIFYEILKESHKACKVPFNERKYLALRNEELTNKLIPFLSEPWYCCAEPTEKQFAPDNLV